MDSLTRNRTTVRSYEAIAREYAVSTAGTPSGVGEAGMRRLVAAVPRGATILELGSGPGWDADFVESLGPRVRRTDVTSAFREFQTQRGKQVEPLDAITDAYTDDDNPAYDGIMALAVLQHIDRAATDAVLGKVAQALRPGGAFLVTTREGTGDYWDVGSSGNRYHVTLWAADAFSARMAAAGLTPVWSARSLNDDEAWFTVLARRSS